MNRGVVRVLLGTIALIGAVILLGYLLPRRSVVHRSDEVAAPPATVYALLSDPRAARRWSPWRDTRDRYLFSGALLGVGARMDWSGAGRGSSVVEEAVPYARVVQRMDLDGRLLRGTFQLTRSAQGTHVIWNLESDAGADPLSRWNALFSRAALNATLVRGLDRLGDVAEALPHADMEAANVRLVSTPARRFAFVEGETDRDPVAIARSLAAASRLVAVGLRRGGATPSSGPIWIATGEAGAERVSYRAGLAFEGGAPSGPGVSLGLLEGGLMVRADHAGSPEALPQTEAAARLFQGVHQLAPAGRPIVEFSADPIGTPEDKLTVTLTLPVRASG